MPESLTTFEEADGLEKRELLVIIAPTLQELGLELFVCRILQGQVVVQLIVECLEIVLGIVRPSRYPHVHGVIELWLGLVVAPFFSIALSDLCHLATNLLDSLDADMDAAGLLQERLDLIGSHRLLANHLTVRSIERLFILSEILDFKESHHALFVLTED